MCEMYFDASKEAYTVANVPEIMLDIIIDQCFSVPAYQWIGEILADEKATADAVAQEKAATDTDRAVHAKMIQIAAGRGRA